MGGKRSSARLLFRCFRRLCFDCRQLFMLFLKDTLAKMLHLNYTCFFCIIIIVVSPGFRLIVFTQNARHHSWITFRRTTQLSLPLKDVRPDSEVCWTIHRQWFVRHYSSQTLWIRRGVLCRRHRCCRRCSVCCSRSCCCYVACQTWVIWTAQNWLLCSLQSNNSNNNT